MHTHLKNDLAAMDAILDRARELAGAYLDGLDQRPVAASLPRDVSAHVVLPEQGMGALEALEQFHRDYDAMLSGSPGARYFGFVTGGGTPAALAADWLVSTYDQNTQRNGDTCASVIELQAVDMLRQLLDWPSAWTGTCVTGATMANYVGMAMARQWVGHEYGRDVAAEGLHGLPPVPVFAGSAHSSTLKALSMAGMGRHAIHVIPQQDGREALRVDELARLLRERGDQPSIVVASAGTVNTVDFDDLAALAELKRQHRFWLHVDAAFGGVAAASVPRRTLMAGIEAADSVTVDAHKWLNVPYDCAIAYTAHLPLQLEVFQNHSAYLPVPEPIPDHFLHLAPENSRRFRALPLWMTLQAYGRDGYAEMVERNCGAAKRLGELIAGDPRWRLAAPVRLNVVCFAPVDANAAAIARLQKALHADGTAYVSPSSLHGQPILRAAICNWRTTMDDVDRTFEALQRLLP
ncbi:pyridoxal phosphate-dependent decarboxylase family protein [Dyella terrae]|uniref:pyridoxal phosphate-dependent decarboxylase family protein n=1 Tax=Dyella terrae TaxID=522259 RepID=UPI001EFE371C|nr:pyridoxal-dependent decarboxylase [Dyella terrae]ULU24919.1 aspartate aminotransferase family protein [Dyella terrae]